MGRTVLNRYVFPAVIGHVIPWSWHASGWSTGKGSHMGPTWPWTTVLAAVMLLPAKEPDYLLKVKMGEASKIIITTTWFKLPIIWNQLPSVASTQPRSQGLSSLPFQRPREAEKRDPGNEVASPCEHTRAKHVFLWRQTYEFFKFSHPNVNFYFSTLLKGKMILINKKGRNYQKGVPLLTICGIKWKNLWRIILS